MNRASERLATGLRINHAGDDAAGLAIAETLKVNHHILTQAIRNMGDGVSMVAIADGALSQISAIATRGAELAQQAANGVYSTEQKQALQNEAVALIEEIDRISRTTTFNDRQLLYGFLSSTGSQQDILTGLMSSWLEQSEQLISTYYGLTGDGAPLQVVLQDNIPAYLASVSGNLNGAGKVVNQQLNIDISDFVPATLPNGGNAPFYDDRIIAHEMVHAVMGRTMNFGALPTWFIEGTAEFIHGADERLYSDVFSNGGLGGVGAAAVANQIDLAWTGSSLQYSSGYAAVRYLHDRIVTAGGNGIIDIMTYLTTNQSDDLDDALINITNGSYGGGLAALYADFKTGGNGAAYILSLEAVQLVNVDTGAIGGADADGGAVRSATSVIPDIVNLTNDPLTGFAESFPTINTDDGTFTFQVGLHGANVMSMQMRETSSAALNLLNIDLIQSTNARDALDRFKAALGTIARLRGSLGAIESRFETAMHFVGTMVQNFKGAESTIRDADVADETARLTSAKILTESSTAVLAQANVSSARALQLLEG